MKTEVHERPAILSRAEQSRRAISPSNLAEQSHLRLNIKIRMLCAASEREQVLWQLRVKTEAMTFDGWWCASGMVPACSGLLGYLD